MDTGEDKPDSDIEYSGITDYDGYRTDQVEWMKELYKNENFKQAKFKVVIAHMPPSADLNIWHGQKDVLKKFVPILNELGVDPVSYTHLDVYKRQLIMVMLVFRMYRLCLIA